MTNTLFVPRRFADAIERVAWRRSASPSAPSLQQQGVSLATIRAHRDRVARLLVRDLLDLRLPPEPGRVFEIQRDGKARRLFEFPLLEQVIHDAVAHWLAEQADAELAPCLYSYRRGVGYQRALRDFARYVDHAMRAPDPGLFVLRRDVRSYFDSIPVHDGAPLWDILARVVGNTPHQAVVWSVLRRVLRPPLEQADGSTAALERGIPTGSPVANVVANLYLGALDQQLRHVPGAFYARYGDDIIAAHPASSSARELNLLLSTHLAPTGLEFGTTKSLDLFLNLAGGRAAPDTQFRPAGAVEFLGHVVSARGAVSLNVPKTRALLHDLRTRAACGARAQPQSVDARVSGAVRAINRVLDPSDGAAHPYARLLRTTVTDRSYLKWLDHELALIALEAALGSKRTAHFRRYPPRELRSHFRLRSVVAARNRVGKR